MILNLKRDLFTSSETLGWLSYGNKKWATIERPWVPVSEAPCGSKGASCIAPGLYRVAPYNSEAHPNVWSLSNAQLWVYVWPNEVPVDRKDLARTNVLIHPANWASELRGCVALGKRRERDVGGWMVKESRDAVNELRGILTNQFDISLLIEGNPGV